MTVQSNSTPPAEHIVDDALVGALLREQHPDLAHLPIRFVDAGWDNAMFRLGDHLMVRLPRRAVAASLIAHEQAVLPHLAPHLPVPIPVPVRIGMPSLGYPWRWSVIPWIDGTTADLEPLVPGKGVALALFLNALHVPAPDDAPSNSVRGVPLATRNEVVSARLLRLAAATDLITPEAKAAWQQALAADATFEPVWLHGDLYPRNVLVKDGAIAAIIDWGDVCAGDKATDLASLWMLLATRPERETAMAHSKGVTDADWARARGWAVSFGSILLETGLVDQPRHTAIGKAILQAISDGP